jgi:sec-independent protein translocase protein TatB
MFDIGIGEIILMAVVGLLIFGPDRLPKAAADAAKWLTQIRAMATGARKDLVDSAGLDLTETVETVKSLQEFHPRRLATSLFNDAPAPPPPAQEPAPAPAPRAAFDPDAT